MDASEKYDVSKEDLQRLASLSGIPIFLLALSLWERSLALAQGVVLTAQPALRIAQLLIDPDCVDWNIEPDPLRALSLFQQAEIGLRIDITENGLTYYRKRLQEAVDGEARARELARALGY